MAKRNKRKHRHKYRERRKKRMLDKILANLKASERIMFAGTDRFGETYKIITLRRQSLHPGFATVIGHRAYNDGHLIDASVCVTWERALKMHDYWVETLVRGPLPDAIVDIGMGQWALGKLIYPRAKKYQEGG